MKMLIENWLKAKEEEKIAQENRRVIEDIIFIQLGVDSAKEGTETFQVDDYKIKATKRFRKYVEADYLQEIAQEHGLSQHLGDLFKWTPTINAKQWKNADKAITDVLWRAITVEPARTSFSIQKTDNEA